MKTITQVFLTKGQLDYFCLAEKDGPELEVYASSRLINLESGSKINGQVLQIDMDDETAELLIHNILKHIPLKSVKPGIYDFVQ